VTDWEFKWDDFSLPLLDGQYANPSTVGLVLPRPIGEVGDINTPTVPFVSSGTRPRQVDTVIVSDVHLGTDLSRADVLIRTLKESVFRRLILLGDILDDVNFARLPRSHWAFLSYLRTLCAAGSGIEVVWVEGNHDHLLSRVTRSFLGLPIHKRYQWVYEGRTVLAMHGHQFDTFISHHPFITEIACVFYSSLQRLDVEQHRLSRFLKRTSKTWLRMSEHVARRAAQYAERRGADYIICGHTHQALSRTFGKIGYRNAGCWTDRPATFITVGDHGVELNERF
jgi:UDP-2,3-diacylglucosamine pyrophosphatase LpxH